MASEIEARDLLYALVIANSPFLVPRQIGIPADVMLDASPSPIWAPRNVVLGHETAPAVPDHLAAWAHLRVEHETRERSSLSGRGKDVRGNVEVLIHSRLGDQSAAAVGSLLTRAIADVLDPSPSPLRFADGTTLYLLGALSEALPLATKSKWLQFRITAPYSWHDRGR